MQLVQHPADVQVVIPARNEEDCIGRCLESLVSQQGIAFQITVVDDGSTDRTRAIAESFARVRVIAAGEPAPGVMGKCNALMTGTRGATAEWLLLTDADTFHYPGSMAAAVHEANEHGADLLSYSPEQETGSLAELALLPVIFAELAHTYPPKLVNDPDSPVAAVNGQYILVRRNVYEELGGHAAVAGKVLEDVELALLFKRARKKIWFRQGTGLVRTRMYRDFRSMREGWTKNLALLFPRPIQLALIRAREFVTLPLALFIAAVLFLEPRPALAWAFVGIGALYYALFLMRARKAHFPWPANLMAFLGLPLFVYLLCRSWFHAKVRHTVVWKGRTYTQSAPPAPLSSSIRKGSLS
jgi:glycosyltransferase involved in cell wall biosynthesis